MGIQEKRGEKEKGNKIHLVKAQIEGTLLVRISRVILMATCITLVATATTQYPLAGVEKGERKKIK